MFQEINNRKQRVYCLSYFLKQLSHPAVLHQMLNMSVLLLDDTLLKCVVTEVSHLVLNCCFEYIDISQGSVATYLHCGRVSSDSTKFRNGQYLMKLRRTKKFANFWGPLCK